MSGIDFKKPLPDDLTFPEIKKGKGRPRGANLFTVAKAIETYQRERINGATDRLAKQRASTASGLSKSAIERHLDSLQSIKEGRNYFTFITTETGGALVSLPERPRYRSQKKPIFKLFSKKFNKKG